MSPRTNPSDGMAAPPRPSEPPSILPPTEAPADPVGPAGPTDPARLEQLEARLVELQRVVDAQHREIARLGDLIGVGSEVIADPAFTLCEPASVDRPASDTGNGSGPGQAAPTDRMHRRELLSRSGALAGGAVLAAGATGAVSLATATPAAASAGVFDGNPAVTASGIGGDGVVGTTDTSAKSGVYGATSASGAVGMTARNYGPGRALEAYSGTGDAIMGLSTSGTGVYGRSASQFGVYGATTTGYGLRTECSDPNTGAHLYFEPANGDPRTRTGTHYAGELIFDGTMNSLWACVASGTPGTWRRIASPGYAGAFHVLDGAIRVYDSRPGFSPPTPPKTPMTAGLTRTIPCSGAGTPTGPVALLVNLTVTNTSSNGFVGLFKNGIPWPGNSSINWDHTGTNVANSAVVACDGLTRIAAYASSTTDIIIDIMGYWI